MNLYTADLHFGHRASITFDHRPFADIDEMDRVLIELWNSRVSFSDNVYIVGDFAYKNEKPFVWYLRQLKGHKHLIIGNHDNKLLNDSSALGYFDSINDRLRFSDGDKKLELSHYPIAEWNGFYGDVYHIYAHIHNKTEDTFRYMRQFDRALNAGCMINNYTPASINELIRNNQIFKEAHL